MRPCVGERGVPPWCTRCPCLMTGHRAAPRRSSANRSSRRPTPGARCAAVWPRRSSPARMPAPHTAIPCARPRSRESRVVPCRIPNSSRRRRCILRRAGCTDAHRRCGECRRPRTRPSSGFRSIITSAVPFRGIWRAPNGNVWSGPLFFYYIGGCYLPTNSLRDSYETR